MSGKITEQEPEHPAFTRAKALPETLRQLFATSPAEVATWRARTYRHALTSRVLVVAQTRIECAWAAYCDAVPGINHDHEEGAVLLHGGKLPESVARVLFPYFAEVPYAH